MSLPGLPELRAAQALVRAAVPPTPQHRWPLLEQALAAAPGDGTALWVKHENHTPVGAFKVRGGVVYLHHLMQAAQAPAGLVSATRGNHGQSIARAAAAYGLPVTIVVPRGNSREKNAAMRALGAELIEHGEDFQAAREHAQALAAARGWVMVPSFHQHLVAGVASYALELFDAVPGLQRVYVPIGLGSGAAGLIAARDALGLDCEIVGVVSTGAPAYALSLAAGQPVSHAVSTVLADGMACRTPEPAALPLLAAGLARIVQVSDAKVAEAMRQLFEATHQVAEGAGAAAWAAALAEREQLAGRCTAVILSGGNVDREVYQAVLACQTPSS
ncbi:threonine dehydratase [Ideonella sp. DXS22W]|uniref:Threonine dehydratase n=1 Tax=Pseudaquabacterium inlustre TaxID=2984192 RepID=A0ABU9CRI0_9BURK